MKKAKEKVKHWVYGRRNKEKAGAVRNLIFAAALVKTEQRADCMKNIIIDGSSQYREGPGLLSV